MKLGYSENIMTIYCDILGFQETTYIMNNGKLTPAVWLNVLHTYHIHITYLPSDISKRCGKKMVDYGCRHAEQKR